MANRLRELIQQVSRIEVVLAGMVGLILVGLTVARPEILEAPFENWRTVTLTFGTALLAIAAYLIMLGKKIPPLVRMTAVGIPLVVVTWWLVSPFFIDRVANDDFAGSIDAQSTNPDLPTTSETSGVETSDSPDPSITPTTEDSSKPAEPVLLGSGELAGLAGHEGQGQAGFFTDTDGTLVLRLENLDIQNGPDLRLYVIPGADQRDPTADSVYLGELKGNIGNQTYELPDTFSLNPGPWTVLVWCEAFKVEFVGATVTVT